MSSGETRKNKLLFLQNELNKYGFKSTINDIDNALYFGDFDLSKSDRWFVLLMKVKANNEGYVITYVTFESLIANIYYHGANIVTVEFALDLDEGEKYSFAVNEDRLKFTEEDVPEFAKNPVGFVINKIGFLDKFPDDEYIYWIDGVLYSDYKRTSLTHEGGST